VTTGRWPVISALGIVQIFAWGSSYYLMAVLAAPIVHDTGWPLTKVVAAVSIGLLCAGLASPLVGRAIAQHGGRPVLAVGVGLLAVGLLIVAVAQTLAFFWFGWAVMGLGMAAGLYDPAFATLGRLYGRDARSAITTLTLWGGFAATICWPLSAWLLDLFGWRGVAVSYAAIHLCLCLPIILWLIPKEPQAPAKTKHGAATLTPDERVVFLVMSALMVLAGLLVTTLSIHLLTILQARGMSLTEAVALGTLIGPAQVASRLLEMAGRGRHHPAWTMLAATCLTASGLVLLGTGLVWPGAALILYGAGNGIFSIARGALPMTLFGPERYAEIMGRLARPSLLAQAAAPMVGAWMIAQGGATGALMAVMALAGINAFLAILLMSLRARVAPHAI